MARRGSAKRNIILFVIAVAVLAALIVILPRLSRVQMIMPPESPEVQARRLAPENAYFVLTEAAALWPEKQREPLTRPTAGVPPAFKPAPISLGAFLGIQRPDDDPELLDFLRQCEPALAKAREALTRSYYLVGVPWSELAEPNPEKPWLAVPIRRLSMGLAARALQCMRSGGDAEETARDLLDAVRLGLLISSDGEIRGLSTHMMSYGLTSMDEFGRYASADLVRRVSNEIAALSAQLKSPAPNLEFDFRLLDNTVRAPDAFAMQVWGNSRQADPRTDEVKKFATRVWLAIRLRSARKIIAAHRDDLLAAVAQPFPEFIAWWRSQGEFTAERARLWPFEDFLAAAMQLQEAHARAQAWFAGARLALALELHHKAHGAYPDALAALVPECVEALPADPYTGDPFLYERHDDDYLLYAVGPNQKDNGKGVTLDTPRTRRRDDVIIHIPPSAK